MSPDKNPDTAEQLAPAPEGFAARARRWLDLYAVRAGVIFLCVLVVIGLILFLAGNQPAQKRGRFGEAQPVGVAKVTQGSMPITLNALGTVTPLATVIVRPQVSGPVVSFHFTEGQMVKKGDVLAVIDPRPFQAALEQAKGQLARDAAALANAKTDLARYQSLWDTKAISQQQLATQRALVKQDEGVVASDQGSVDAAALNLSYTKVTSPVDGRAGIRQVDIGNLVQAGQTDGIVTITQIDPMSVIFAIPEDNIDQVMTRMNAGAMLQADAYDRTQSRKLATGTLSAVDSTIDTTTGTVKLRALFDNAGNALFPNQFVNIHLLVDTQKNRTLAPIAAIQRGAQGTFVFVANPDKTVAMRAVEIGATDGANTVITKGLKPGDTIVVDGADRLSDGATIEVPAAPKAAIAAPSAAPAGQPAPPPGRQDRFQRMLKRLPAAQQEELKKMTPDQRREWFHKHRGELRPRGGQ